MNITQQTISWRERPGCPARRCQLSFQGCPRSTILRGLCRILGTTPERCRSALSPISHDTPDFAADNLVRWWQREGLERYRDASELLVLADSGGSNAPRIRCFKYALQTRLAAPHHLKVTVCHYPSGASKWNPIDHRLFSEISKNWAGHPLRSYQTILNHIRTTTTDTGLCVTAQLVDQEYPKGVKISDAQFASIALQPHQVQPLRNYTICPRP